MHHFCRATWSGGACARESASNGLCYTHDQQRRRGKPFTAIRIAHGKDPRDLRPLSVSIPAEDLATLAAEAQSKSAPVSEIVREVLAEYTQRTRERQR